MSSSLLVGALFLEGNVKVMGCEELPVNYLLWFLALTPTAPFVKASPVPFPRLPKGRVPGPESVVF